MWLFQTLSGHFHVFQVESRASQPQSLRRSTYKEAIPAQTLQDSRINHRTGSRNTRKGTKCAKGFRGFRVLSRSLRSKRLPREPSSICPRIVYFSHLRYLFHRQAHPPVHLSPHRNARTILQGQPTPVYHSFHLCARMCGCSRNCQVTFGH
jgi:hypothetical protein